jgi:hypothetical protein
MPGPHGVNGRYASGKIEKRKKKNKMWYYNPWGRFGPTGDAARIDTISSNGTK